MSAIVDRLPTVAEIDARIEAERVVEGQVTERLGAVRREYAAAHAKWEQEALDAELAGKRVPVRPEQPDDTISTLALERVRGSIRGLVQARLRAVVDGAETVHEQSTSEILAVLEEAAPYVEALKALLPRLRAATSAVDAVADARQALDPQQTTPRRHVPRIDLTALLAAVGGGPAVLLSGRDPLPARRLGFADRRGMDDPENAADVAQTVTESPATRQSVSVQATARGATP